MPLEEGKVTHFNILPWRIPWTVMDCLIHGIIKSQTGLSDFHFHFLKCKEILTYKKKQDGRGSGRCCRTLKVRKGCGLNSGQPWKF